MNGLRTCFVVDSGTDVRLVDSLAERTRLRVLARRIAGGREISQTPARPLDLEVGPAGHGRFALFAGKRLLALRGEVDVVLVQGYGAAAASANIVGRLIGLPVFMLVCSPTEAYYRCRLRPGSTRRFRRIEYLAIEVFRALNAWIGRRYVALSPYLASVVGGRAGRRSVSVIPVYGVDRSVFHRTAEPKQAIRARLRIPEDRPIVFFSSRIAPEKDAESVLRAVGLLADAGRPVRLLHLSGGHREFVELARRLGVERDVVAAEAVVPFAPLADYYRASDVCVQASHEEGLGFSVLEALACGTPVVAAAVGGLKDTICGGETGWQVPAGDAGALAAAICEVLDAPAEAERRTRRGEALVDRSYAREHVFDLLLEQLNAASRLDHRQPAAQGEAPVR